MSDEQLAERDNVQPQSEQQLLVLLKYIYIHI